MLLGFFLLLFSVCVRFLKAFSALYGYRWVCNVLYKQYLHITAHPLCVCRRYASATEVLIPGSLTRFFQIYQLFFLSLSLSFARNSSSYTPLNWIVYISSADEWLKCSLFQIETEDMSSNVMLILRQVDSLFLLLFCFFRLLYIVRWTTSKTPNQCIKVDNNETGTKLWLIDDQFQSDLLRNELHRAQLWSKNVRNIRFLISSINKSSEGKFSFILNVWIMHELRDEQISQIHFESLLEIDASRLFEHLNVLVSQICFFFLFSLLWKWCVLWTSFFSRIS